MATRTRTAFRFDLPLLALRGSAALRLSDLLSLARQRRALAGLDADRLADIGVTRQEALEEADRPVWDVPAHWQR